MFFYRNVLNIKFVHWNTHHVVLSLVFEDMVLKWILRYCKIDFVFYFKIPVISIQPTLFPDRTKSNYLLTESTCQDKLQHLLPWESKQLLYKIHLLQSRCWRKTNSGVFRTKITLVKIYRASSAVKRSLQVPRWWGVACAGRAVGRGRPTVSSVFRWIIFLWWPSARKLFAVMEWAILV